VESIKETTQAFVVRIWIEHQQRKNAKPVWRGVIERVDSGDRVYFDQLDKIGAYFAKYLDELGIQLDNPAK
jgi:hypothetical protein